MRKLIGNLVRPTYRRSFLKKKIKLHSSARVFFPERAAIGQYVYIGPNCMINAEGGLRLGDGSILGPEVVILTSSHDYRVGDLLPYDVYDQHRPVDIGAGVWIGYRAMIAPGVTIGDGAIVAMGAIAAKDVKPGEVVAGNPAVRIHGRDSLEITRKVNQQAFFHRKYWSGHRPRKTSPGK